MKDRFVDLRKLVKNAFLKRSNTEMAFFRITYITTLPLTLVCSFANSQEVGREYSPSTQLNTQMATRTYYDGAETLGRVGHEAILRRDILHQIKKLAHMRYLEEIEKIPEEEREKVRQDYKNGILNQYLNSPEAFSNILDNHIRKLLFYNDYIVSRPKEQVQEQTQQLEKEFDKHVLPDLEEKFNCKNVLELEKYFDEEIQSDFAQEKRIFLQHTLGDLWMGYNLGEEEFSPTLSDLKRYYEANIDQYRVTAKARWQGMTVYYGVGVRTLEEARKKIAHMGNAVQSAKTTEQEALFAEVCKVDSEDSCSSRGGYRDWTTKGELASKEIENAIFSEELPIGALSRIIESSSALSIIRVIERETERIKPFTEVQETVREDLIEARTEAMKQKYEERLSDRFKVEIYALTPEEREKCFHSANREETSASGRPIY